jgi:hypothetical protein
MTILLAITFILGPFDLVLTLLNRALKIKKDVVTLFIEETPLLNITGKAITIFSLIFQAYHWLFQQAIVY